METSTPRASASDPPMQVEKFAPTHGCPSCQTGMQAPGIRHSATCKKRCAEWSEQLNAKERRIEQPSAPSEPPVDVTASTPVVTSDFIPREQEFQQRFKRKAETETDHLEQEMKRQAMELEAPMDSLGFCWIETGEPVQLWNLSQIEGVPFLPFDWSGHV